MTVSFGAYRSLWRSGSEGIAGLNRTYRPTENTFSSRSSCHICSPFSASGDLGTEFVEAVTS